MKSGQLKITPGLTLQIYYGPKTVYDSAASKLKVRNFMVYMPWATSKSTGLPEVPMASNHPWIMNSGTHKAHIMISPLQKIALIGTISSLKEKQGPLCWSKIPLAFFYCLLVGLIKVLKDKRQ
jgi:hypothetical protein